MNEAIKQIVMRITHKLTAHHWRHNRRGLTIIGYCSCGYEAWFSRKIKLKTRWRKLYKLCWLRGHDLGELEGVHCGPVGFEESEDTLVWQYRRCDRCWTCVNS